MKQSTHRSLERGLTLLESVAASTGAVSLAETARKTGLHRSTAHHLLQALVRLGYLWQDAESRGYEISAKPFQLTGQTWSADQLAAIGQPILAEVTRRAGEGSSLAAYRDGAVTVVAKREHDGPVRVAQDAAARRPLHCTAVAKAILPWLPKPELERIVARLRLKRMTPKTIVSRSAFEDELRRIRIAGYALDDEEHIEGIRCIAVPVFGHNGRVLASLCTLGPKSRMTYQRLRDLRTPLAELSGEMSRRLGYHG